MRLLLTSLALGFLAVHFLLTTTTAEPLVWMGAVTSTSFTIHADVPANVSLVVLSTTATFDTIIATADPSAANATVGDQAIYSRLRRLVFASLTPSTKYHVGLQTSSTLKPTVLASVRTFPPEDVASDVVFALSSCQLKSHWDAALGDIHTRFSRHTTTSTAPFLMLHMGDLHYEDIARNDVALYESATRSVLMQSRAHSLFASIPVAYVYDDHDYGINNADFTSPSRSAALAHYRAMVPSYPLAGPVGAYHAFTVGRVRVLITDLRAFARQQADSTLGDIQRTWLLRELSNASKYSVVVWLSSKPWIGRSQGGKDSWGGYAQERKTIANHISKLNISNLVMVAGDAHMLAADNGSNSDYATEGGSGFPVFQAAPLSHIGSSKGGPYSEGCFGFRRFFNEQYGELRVTRTGVGEEGPCVEFRGFQVGALDDAVLTFRRCGKLGGVVGEGGQETSCSMSLIPTWAWATAAVALLWICSMVATTVLACVVWRQAGPEITDEHANGRKL